MAEKYNVWRERKRLHWKIRHVQNTRRGAVSDPACMTCFPVGGNDIGDRFRGFWNIFKEIIPAETYNRNTVQNLNNLAAMNMDSPIERETERIRANLDRLIESINYRERPNYELWD